MFVSVQKEISFILLDTSVEPGELMRCLSPFRRQGLKEKDRHIILQEEQLAALCLSVPVEERMGFVESFKKRMVHVFEIESTDPVADALSIKKMLPGVHVPSDLKSVETWKFALNMVPEKRKANPS